MNKYKMGNLEGNFTPVLYMWDARFLKANIKAVGLRTQLAMCFKGVSQYHGHFWSMNVSGRRVERPRTH